MMHTPLDKYCTITRIPDYRVIMSTNVPLDIYTDISWCKEAHRLRWAYLFACKSPLKYWLSALFLQEYTGGRTRENRALPDR